MEAEKEVFNDMILDKIQIAIERARISNAVKHFLLLSASTTSREAYFGELGSYLAETPNAYVLKLSTKKTERFNAQLIQELHAMFSEKIEASQELEIAELIEEIVKNLKTENAVLVLALTDLHVAQKDELTTILSLLHQASRGSWPVVFVVSGDVSLIKKLGEATPYAERAFEVHKIGLRQDLTNQ